MVDPERNRPRWSGTLAADVVAYLNQDHINASRLVEHAIRQTVDDDKIREAAHNAAMSDEEIREARNR